MTRIIALSTAALMGFGAAAAAQSMSASEVLAPAPTILVERYSKITPEGLSPETLIGAEIFSTDGVLIGEVEQMFEDDTIIAGLGGFLGLGEYDVALPAEVVSWFEYDGPTTEFRVYIDATEEQLRTIAPFTAG